jgi:hypothetical protein
MCVFYEIQQCGGLGYCGLVTQQKINLHVNSASIFPYFLVTAVSQHHEELWVLDQFTFISSTDWDQSMQISNY